MLFSLRRVAASSPTSPEVGGLTALKVQRFGSRLGNENYDIYTLALLQRFGLVKVFHNNIPGDNGLHSAHQGYSRVLGNGTVIGISFLLAPLVPPAGTPQTPSNP